jgi:sugar lactone lactonase YvrE
VKRLSVFAAVAVLGAVTAGTWAEGVRIRVLTGIYADAKGVGLKSPEGVAAPDAGRIVVADTGNGRLVEYQVTPDAVTALGEMSFPELPYPIRVAGRAKGDLFVLDGKMRRIGRVSGGAFTGWVEPALEGEIVPRALRVDGSGNLWILDVAAPRVLVLGKDDQVARTIPLPATPGAFYSDLAVGPHGDLFVLESVGRRLWIVPDKATEAKPFGPELATELDFANSIAVDASGRVFVADQNGGGIVVIGVDGSFQGRQSGPGWKEGLLRYPSALAIDPAGRLLVADRGNNRVAMFGLAE